MMHRAPALRPRPKRPCDRRAATSLPRRHRPCRLRSPPRALPRSPALYCSRFPERECYPRLHPALANSKLHGIATNGSRETGITKSRARVLACFLIAVGAIASFDAASAQTLRIGLAEDPDFLDPTLARTYVGRIVFAALCDKLVDIGPELEIVPQLATEWQWTDANKGLILKLRP